MGKCIVDNMMLHSYAVLLAIRARNIFSVTVNDQIEMDKNQLAKNK